MTEKYFSYDPEDGIEFHNTIEEAKKVAEEILDITRDNAANYEWDGTCVHQICWGKVVEKAEMVSSKPAPKYSQFTTLDEYELVPVDTDKNKLFVKPENNIIEIDEDIRKFIDSLRPKEKEILKKLIGKK